MELRFSQGSNTALRVQFFFLILQSLFHRLQVYSVILQCVVLNSLGAVTLSRYAYKPSLSRYIYKLSRCRHSPGIHKLSRCLHSQGTLSLNISFTTALQICMLEGCSSSRGTLQVSMPSNYIKKQHSVDLGNIEAVLPMIEPHLTVLGSHMPSNPHIV